MIAPKLTALVSRATLGAVTAAAIALGAWRTRSLSRSGGIAAAAIGTIAAAAGWGWAIVLIAYFIGAVSVSRLGASRKAARTAQVVMKVGPRDAAQVLANGSVFAMMALGALLYKNNELAWQWPAIGALAASSADTWATEIGTLVGGIPRSIINRTNVHPGVSGGMTLAGTIGALAGAALIGGIAYLAGWPAGAALASIVAGMIGMISDSLLGATLQTRRWCDRCQVVTERATHPCGTVTRAHAGLSWMNNDVVNVIATMIGAGISTIAFILWR